MEIGPLLCRGRADAYFFFAGGRCLRAQSCKSFTWPSLSLGTGGTGGFDPPLRVEIERPGPDGFSA